MIGSKFGQETPTGLAQAYAITGRMQVTRMD